MHAIKAYEGAEVLLQASITSALRWRCVMSFAFRLLYPWVRSLGARSLRGFVGSRADLDAVENGESLTLIGNRMVTPLFYSS